MKIKNLYLAGDFVKNDIDLACMEGAVSRHWRLRVRFSAILERPNRFRLSTRRRCGRVARVMAWLEEKYSPHRPDASRIRRGAIPKFKFDLRPLRKR